MKPLSHKTVKDLLKGKFISIHELLRQPQSSYQPPTNQVQLGAGILLSSSPQPKHRSVESPLDWIEAYLSSVLPSLALNTQRATTLTEARVANKQLQQHLTHALNAVVLFRRAPSNFQSSLKYLESHRQDCTEQPNSNVAQPDVLKLTSINQDAAIMAGAQAAAAAAYSNPHPHPHTQQPAALSLSKTPRLNAAAQGKCGNYNSRMGCQRLTGTCPYAHACLLCNSTAHGKPDCPQSVPKPAKPAATATTTASRTQPPASSTSATYPVRH